MRIALPLLAALLVVTGCSSNKALIINDQQSLVMDSNVLTAGITASRPSLDTDKGRKQAWADISNGQNHAVTIHYRFYWYDEQGLDVLPYPETHTLVVPSDSSVRVQAVNGNLEARRVRLYLYL
ncbi:YcfL family protein [Biostraticola tofi]|uniref:Uncharacterized protein YcfL n=1 Tax=Biostraticola tofi TaxID=466109 RepID=A0A4R3YZZ0_9GAMM|nr:DUF1425 domain-containing protein [Biostraticola tofi]TCV98260.1 uncharacterized protein YcfL [Biostraticola tofi]